MRLPEIDGRQLVPVRVIPYLTQSDPLSPDVLAAVLAESAFYRRWGLRAHQVGPDGKLFTWMPRQWDIVCERLAAERVRINREQLSRAEGVIQWEERSLALLPAAVFVWRDELEHEYARTFGRGDFGAESMPPGRHRRREGDRVLDIDAMPDPAIELRGVVFEGFDVALGQRDPDDGNRGLADREITRKALEAAFPEVKWRSAWNNEDENGLATARLDKAGKTVWYSAQRVADWLWNVKRIPLPEARRKLDLPSGSQRPNPFDQLLKGPR